MSKSHVEIDARPPRAAWRDKLRDLYIGEGSAARRFQMSVASIDVVIITFFIFAPVLQEKPWFLWFDYAVAVLLTIDLSARAAAARDTGRWLRRPAVWVDFVVLATLLGPLWLANLGFLRILRLWTL